jgi:hypothetical protein
MACSNSLKRGYLYYTSTAKQLFMRVKVEPETYDPVGEPEVVGGGRMFDDFCIDQDVGIHFELRKRRLVFWKAILFANPRQDSQVR